MNIVFSIKALNNAGGTERVTAVISSQLARRGHNVHIVSFVGGGNEPFFNIDPAVKCHYLAGAKDHHLFPVRDIRRIIFLRRLYREINPDVIIIVDAGRSFVNIPAARGYKVITWEHFNVEHNWHWGHHLSRVIAAKYSDAIVALTQRDANYYSSTLKAKRVVCIYNPVTIDCSVPSPLTAKVCLAVGRLTKDKNFIDLIRAWSKTNAKESDWTLHIIGSGALQSMLEAEVGKLGLGDSVKFLGPKNDMVEQYSNASICALSSLHEGLPLTLIEAMSMGLPIVSYDCPTGPAEIVDDGVTGVLVPPLDVNRLGAELEKLMNDPERLKLYSRNALKESHKFDVENIIGQWESLFKTL